MSLQVPRNSEDGFGTERPVVPFSKLSKRENKAKFIRSATSFDACGGIGVPAASWLFCSWLRGFKSGLIGVFTLDQAETVAEGATLAKRFSGKSPS